MFQSMQSFIIKYYLNLIQEFRNKIEAAWTSLSTRSIKPRINLETDSKINPCYSFSERLSPRILVILLVFGFYSLT
jgi:hypothetical protein